MRSNVRRFALAYLEAAEAAGERGLPALARRFVELLARRRQRRLLPKIIAAIGPLWNERHGITPVRVTTAAPVDPALLAKTLPAGDLSTAVDPEILGGAIVDIGDVRVDGSVRSSLNRLHAALARKES